MAGKKRRPRQRLAQRQPARAVVLSGAGTLACALLWGLVLQDQPLPLTADAAPILGLLPRGHTQFWRAMPPIRDAKQGSYLLFFLWWIFGLRG